MATTKKATTAKKDGKSSSKSTTAKKKAAAKSDSGSRSKTGGGRTTASKKSSSSRAAKPAANQSTAKKSTRSSPPKERSKGTISAIVDRVTEMFSSSSLTATDLLKADHKKVSLLFDKVKENEDGNNVPTFKKIKTELEIHTYIEEKIFYPYLLEKGDKELKDQTREALEEHAQAKTVLEEIAATAGNTPTFKAKLKVLMEDIEHHVKEEENEMFPMVEDQFSQKILENLGERLQKEKGTLQTNKGARTPAKGKASHA